MNKFHKVSMSEWKLACAKIGLDEKTAEKAYNIELPTRSTKNSAGYDFKAPFSLTVRRGTNYIIPTGIKCEMDADKVLLCYPRSSYGFKYGFRLLNTVGVIDSDYYNNKSNEGHIHLGFVTDQDMVINRGDKLFQAVFTKFYTTNDDSTDGERSGGMGSTGK